ncbi:MAG: SDR family oxidoreductase [Chthoniobacterales bacterium]|nr:SDR family oxidoreductase [Chthoniobacterales bacterium]
MLSSTLSKSTAPDLFQMGGKVVLLTGAAGGFGRALAQGFAQFGASLVLVDQEAMALQALATELETNGTPCLACAADVSVESEVALVTARALEHFNRIDVLLHVAGAAKLSPVTEMSTADFDFTIGSHLRGTFFLVRETGRIMCRQGGGSVVLMSSLASQRALGRGTGPYAAAKAGVNALVRELAVEWAPHNIRVNAVAPCQFRTPGLLAMLADPNFNPGGDLQNRMVSAIPLGRLGEPAELVGPCVFLASEAGSMVTGQVLFVDGGYTAK